MSIFPTKILLATDGSKEAVLAAPLRWIWPKKPAQNCT